MSSLLFITVEEISLEYMEAWSRNTSVKENILHCNHDKPLCLHMSIMESLTILRLLFKALSCANVEGFTGGTTAARTN